MRFFVNTQHRITPFKVLPDDKVIYFHISVFFNFFIAKRT